MEISKTNLIEPNYEGISKMVNSFTELYKVREGHAPMVDKFFEQLATPIQLPTLKLKAEVKNQITKKDVELLNWIYDRFYNVYKEDKNIDFMHALLKLIQKLENNGK